MNHHKQIEQKFDIILDEFKTVYAQARDDFDLESIEVMLGVACNKLEMLRNLVIARRTVDKYESHLKVSFNVKKSQAY